MQTPCWIISRNGGFVADYNATEATCQWVRDMRNATQFASPIVAHNAGKKLDLSSFTVIETSEAELSELIPSRY